MAGADQRRVVVATDGSCLGNPGPGGWAWAISDSIWAAGSHPGTTNNLMEMRAVYELLVAMPRDIPLTIEADSQYVIQVFTEWLEGWQARGWKTASNKRVANLSAIRLLQPLLVGRDVDWVHVYGHRGHPLNEAADGLARAAATAQKEGRRVQTGYAHRLDDYLDRWRKEHVRDP